MAEFLIILGVVAVFLVIFYSSVVREKHKQPLDEPKEEPPARKAA